MLTLLSMPPTAGYDFGSATIALTAANGDELVEGQSKTYTVTLTPPGMDCMAQCGTDDLW